MLLSFQSHDAGWRIGQVAAEFLSVHCAVTPDLFTTNPAAVILGAE